MLIIFMVFAALVETKKPIVGHESAVVIIVGMVLSFSAHWFDNGEFNKMMSFDENFFFYFCLPPIVFASGYNMKRRKFFENIKNILIFGLLSTLV